MLSFTAADAARARQAATVAGRIVWPKTTLVNSQAPIAGAKLLDRCGRFMDVPLRGVLPHLDPDTIEAAYTPRQHADAAPWADEFLGLYWLILRRRVEQERPEKLYADGGPDWKGVAEAHAERLRWVGTARHAGFTALTALRLLYRVHRRGYEALEDMALEQSRAGMEPQFQKTPGGHLRLPWMGRHHVSGFPLPDKVDYRLNGRMLPQLGRGVETAARPVVERI